MISREPFRRYAVELKRSDNKLPGFYSQIVKEVAENISIHDRNREWFVVKTAAEKENLCRLFEKKGVLGEVMEVLELPLPPSPAVEDYGFSTAQERVFLWAEGISLFLWKKDGAHADAQAAREQMEEHLVGSFAWNGGSHEILVVPAHLKAVIPRIAAAYRSKIEEIQ